MGLRSDVLVEGSEAVKPSKRTPQRWFNAADVAVLCLLLTAITVLFFTSPRGGDFWWSDAPRHAMDGVFYRDLIRDAPWQNVPQYAADYYLRYPALTILFYPPLFPMVEAAFFGVFGVSHSTAQLCVAFFYLWVAWGAYVLGRRWMGRGAAFATALLFIGLPEVALWGRQIMLEIPVIAFIVWSAVVFFRYLDRGRAGSLWLFVALICGATYTKQTAIWFVAPCLLLLLLKRGWKALLQRDLIVCFLALAVALIPLAYVQWRFGRVNMNSVVGGTWTTMPVFSLSSWLYYLKIVPEQTGWVTATFAVIGLLLLVVRKTRWKEEDIFLISWFAFGYIFFSLIALKEPRHTTLILFPLAAFAVRGVLGLWKTKLATASVIVLSAVAFAYTVKANPVPYIGGYDQAVNYLVHNAPPNSVILFSGYRDGSLVFDLRARTERRDLSILRADKIFLRVTQRKELGVKDLKMSQAEMSEVLDRYGVTYVVSQPNFWDDVQSMRTLRTVFTSGHFEKVATISTTGNVGRVDQNLEIYRTTSPVRSVREQIKIELPIVGVSVEGTVHSGQ